jgi:hypothetical protein
MILSFTETPFSQRLHHLLQMVQQSARLGYIRKQAMYLHEAASLLLHRHCSSGNSTDAQGALLLEEIVMKLFEKHGWLQLKFYVMRQLISIARRCNGSTDLIVAYTTKLLRLLAQTSLMDNEDFIIFREISWNGVSKPFSETLVSQDRSNMGLHLKPFSAYYSPPPNFEKEVKKALSNGFFNVKNLPSSISAQASATLATTTPRLLSTPRQLMSAVMNTPSNFPMNQDVKEAENTRECDEKRLLNDCPNMLNLHSRSHVKLWQEACWKMLQNDVKCKTSFIFPLSQLLYVHRMEPLLCLLLTLEKVQQLVDAGAVNSTFMYNPFQQKESSKNIPQEVFPLHDLINIELEISNPFEMPLEVSLVTAWAEPRQNACFYGVPITLSSRERNYVLTLQIRPLSVGTLTLQGFLFSMKQQTYR